MVTSPVWSPAAWIWIPPLSLTSSVLNSWFTHRVPEFTHLCNRNNASTNFLGLQWRINWLLVVLRIREACRKNIHMGNQRCNFLAPQFGPGLSPIISFSPDLLHWGLFTDYFTSAWNTSCENSGRGLTSLKGGLTGKWLPSTWNTWSVPKMLLVNFPRPEKGQLMTILGWSISCHINT